MGALEQKAAKYAGSNYVRNHFPKSYNERFNSFIAGFKEATQWIDINDRLPTELGQKVLVIQNHKTTATKEPLFAVFNGFDFIPPTPTYFANIEVGQTKWCDIIFWMPLPEPPPIEL